MKAGKEQKIEEENPIEEAKKPRSFSLSESKQQNKSNHQDELNTKNLSIVTHHDLESSV